MSFGNQSQQQAARLACIIKRGRHVELLARSGAYALMWAKQQQVEQAREALQQAVAEELTSATT
ncbi:MAG: hypothetical protein U1E43_01190 [Rhodospirillales bacterium]